MNHQVVTDYTNVNTENSSVCVYVRARPPDPSWTVEDDDTSAEDKYQNPLQATLAGLSPKSNSGALSSTPQATSSAFISNFPDNPKKICIKDPAAQGSSKHHGEIYFSFDRVFWTECSQEEVFQAVAQPQVDNILNGFNGCCFAYGQTGSGKTYSMFGEGAGNSRGMIPRCMEEVFAQLHTRAKDKEVAVVVSFLEIYCDRVRDLGEAYMSHGEREIDGLKTTSDIYRRMKSSRAESFQPRNKYGSWVASSHAGGASTSGVWDSYLSMDLKIHEDVQGNVFVKDLSLIPVTTLEEVLEIISLGLKLRATHETKMNQVSSRSHTVFTVTVVQKDPFTDEAITGMLNLVDLAGSERLKKSASEGQRKTEALHINSSLTALGKVVMALDPSSGLTHVPYRDSKLTRLLQNSLGGNSFTVVLATVHPIARFSDECLSTLQFANRCRSVHNHPRVNKLGDGAAGDQKKLKKLQEEVQALRRMIGHGGGGGGGAGGADSNPNSRVMTVLAQMGLTGATQLPDGSIRLPDGRIVGEFGIGKDETGGGDGIEGSGGVGGRGASVSGVMKGVSASVQAMVQGLEAEVHASKKKLQERKQELADVTNQHEARRAAFVDNEKESKRRETELTEQLALARARVCEVGESAARAKEEQLTAVLAESQALLRRQRRMLLKVTGHQTRPDGGKKQSQSERHALEARRGEAARHAQSLQALEFSKEVETENLRQQYEQLVQAGLRGRDASQAKLDRCKARRDREVRELSVELLLLHDHAVLLHNIIEAPGLASSPGLTDRASPPPTDGIDKIVPPEGAPTSTPLAALGSAIDLVSPESQSPSTLQHFHSKSHPRLSRLIRARREKCPAGLLAHSRSEFAVRDGQSHTLVRARPKSAGSARWQAPASEHLLSIVARGGKDNAGVLLPARKRENMQDRLAKASGRHTGGVRPMSAPGRRSPAQAGDERSEQHGEEWGEEGEEGGQRVAVGWSTRDEVFRDPAELSRDELLVLVLRLRARVGESGSRRNYGRMVDSKQGEASGKHNAQDLLRDQARRYNDLRVAYQSLSRRLEKGRCGREGGGTGGSIRTRILSSSASKRVGGVKTRGVVGRSGAPETETGTGMLLGGDGPVRDRIRVG